jgi:hypothetical protein
MLKHLKSTELTIYRKKSRVVAAADDLAEPRQLADTRLRLQSQHK